MEALELELELELVPGLVAVLTQPAHTLQPLHPTLQRPTIGWRYGTSNGRGATGSTLAPAGHHGTIQRVTVTIMETRHKWTKMSRTPSCLSPGPPKENHQQRNRRPRHSTRVPTTMRHVWLPSERHTMRCDALRPATLSLRSS